MVCGPAIASALPNDYYFRLEIDYIRVHDVLDSLSNTAGHIYESGISIYISSPLANFGKVAYSALPFVTINTMTKQGRALPRSCMVIFNVTGRKGQTGKCDEPEQLLVLRNAYFSPHARHNLFGFTYEQSSSC